MTGSSEGWQLICLQSVCEESQSVYIIRGFFAALSSVRNRYVILIERTHANRHFGVLVCSGSSGSFFESLYVDVL